MLFGANRLLLDVWMHLVLFLQITDKLSENRQNINNTNNKDTNTKQQATMTTTTTERSNAKNIKQKPQREWLESMIDCICYNNLRWWCRGCNDAMKCNSLRLVGYSDSQIPSDLC